MTAAESIATCAACIFSVDSGWMLSVVEPSTVTAAAAVAIISAAKATAAAAMNSDGSTCAPNPPIDSMDSLLVGFNERMLHEVRTW